MKDVKIYTFEEIEAKLAEIWAQVEPILSKIYNFVMEIKD